jgi:hypothetical protein
LPCVSIGGKARRGRGRTIGNVGAHIIIHDLNIGADCGDLCVTDRRCVVGVVSKYDFIIAGIAIAVFGSLKSAMDVIVRRKIDLCRIDRPITRPRQIG